MKRCIPVLLVLLTGSVLFCTKNAPSTAMPTEPLVFSTAASTKDLMEALAAQFRIESGVDVKVNPGPSSGLANQILAGAPADLFLSANQQWADQVEKGGQAVVKARLLTNKLV